MVRTGIAELKSQLSHFLRITRSGEEVVITDRGRPVARLVPVDDLGDERPVHLLEMERRGEVRVGTGELPEAGLRLPEAVAAAGVSAVQALIDDRREGR